MWKEVAAAAAAVVAAAISVEIVGVIVAPRGFAGTFVSLVAVVVTSVAGFVATTVVEIVATVSVAAASVRDWLAGRSVAEIEILVEGMSA